MLVLIDLKAQHQVVAPFLTDAGQKVHVKKDTFPWV
jgi:hypothetical protein